MPKYELLKTISIKSLEDAGACERELHRFAFLLAKVRGESNLPFRYETELSVERAVEIAAQCLRGIQFLLDKGFIREVEELLPCPFCKAQDAQVRRSDHGQNWFVFCNKCEAVGPLSGSPEQAMKAWNHGI